LTGGAAPGADELVEAVEIGGTHVTSALINRRTGQLVAGSRHRRSGRHKTRPGPRRRGRATVPRGVEEIAEGEHVPGHGGVVRHRASLRDLPNAGSRYAATSSRRVVEDGDRGWRWVRSRTPYAVAPRTLPTTTALRWCPTPRLCGWGPSRLSPGGAGPPGPGPAHGVVHDLPMRESLRFLSGSASSATRTPPQGWRRPAPARVGSVPETPECTVTPVPVFGAHGPGPGRPAPPRPRSSRWGCLSSFQLGHAGSSGELGARRGGAGGDGAVTATAAPGRAVRSAPASRTFGTPYRCSAGPRWCHDHHQVPSGRRRHLARARLSAVSTQLRFAG
jgi:hypothetical protein